MYIVIIGCGRTGSKLAGLLSEKGNDVVVIDKEISRLELLPVEYSGFRVEGDALEQDVLRQAKLEQADVVVIATGNDKVNYMVVQLARVIFQVPKILVRVVNPEKVNLFQDDPVIETLSPILLLVEEFVNKIEGNEG